MWVGNIFGGHKEVVKSSFIGTNWTWYQEESGAAEAAEFKNHTQVSSLLQNQTAGVLTSLHSMENRIFPTLQILRAEIVVRLRHRKFEFSRGKDTSQDSSICFEENKLTKLGHAIPISKSETITHSLARCLWPLRHLIRVMRWHGMTNKKTMRKTFGEHPERVILETCDLWDIVTV